MMRYQRVSPDVLPLPNGRKPNNHPRTCKEDDATFASSFRVRSGSGSANSPLAQTHQDNNSSSSNHHFPPTSDSLPPEPQQQQNQQQQQQQAPSDNSNGGRDVLLQWGHKKRSRGSRTENRTAGDDSFSPSSRQIVKIQRRAAIAGAEKIAAAAAAAAMPPPCGGGGYTRGANLRPNMPLRDSSGANHSRTVEERSGGQNHRSEKRSPPSPPEKPHGNKPAVIHNGFGPTDTAPFMNHHHHSDPKAASDHQQDTTTTTTTTTTAEKVSLDHFEWPRIYVSLSRKEKEDDFLAMKGSKLPQRPKKRAKNIDKALQYCYPGLWLSDLTRGRYEVREKKCVKKKPRGLKGMESMESDSE